MSHKSSISGMGEPVPAIWVINEKQMILITLEINMILNCGREYVKLAWEFICKPGQENLDFLQVKKSEMTRKTKKYCMYWSPLYPGKTLLKNKGRSIRFSDIQKYLTWLKLQECKWFSWFEITQMICILNSSVHQKSLLEKWHIIISNQGKPYAHWSKMAVSTRDRLHNSSLFFKINTPTIRLSFHCSITMVGWHEKQSESNTTSKSSSASASASAVSADWLIAPSLQNVRVDTQYVGINEKQKQQIRQL